MRRLKIPATHGKLKYDLKNDFLRKAHNFCFCKFIDFYCAKGFKQSCQGQQCTQCVMLKVCKEKNN